MPIDNDSNVLIRRYLRCGRNRYKRVIYVAVGLTEEEKDKDPLGAARISKVLNNVRAISVSSKQADQRVKIFAVQNFAVLIFAKSAWA